MLMEFKDKVKFARQKLMLSQADFAKKLGVAFSTVNEWENGVRHPTLTFNKMRFIETEERDEIYMALCDILDEMPESSIQKNDLLEKFEELRDF